MESFLRYCKNYLFTEVHVVLGNESADLDSAVATLVTALFLYQGRSGLNHVVLPVLNVLRKDFNLRTEVNYFLKDANISPDLLIFKDEIDLEKLKKDNKLFLILVDHNVLSLEQQLLEDSVVRVIDHHKPESKDRGERCDTTIEMVGSCCTLVAEKLFNTNPDIIDKQVAMLLYGTILLDTVCLSQEAKRLTSKDVEMVTKLETVLEDVKRVEIFEALQKAKFDVSGLTVNEMLRKDLKVIEGNGFRIAISSIPGPLEDLEVKPKVRDYLEEFLTQNNYHGLVILAVSFDNKTGKVQRQTAVYSTNPVIKEQIVATLQVAEEPQLELKPLNVRVADLVCFSQGNVLASRKVLLPLVQSVIQDPSFSNHVTKALKVEAEIPSVFVGCFSSAETKDDLGDFDPLSPEFGESNTNSPYSGSASATPALSLGIAGEPLSSQSSSTQNSCPYTPQNSFVDDSFDLNNAMMKHSSFLPSFNSRDMVEKIEKKRGKLAGFDRECEASGMRGLSFTPKNSFADCSLDLYEPPKVLTIESNELLEKVREKKASLGTHQQYPDEFQQDKNLLNVEEKVSHLFLELNTANRSEDSSDVSVGEISFDTSKSCSPGEVSNGSEVQPPENIHE
ncbi:exopolyphosphatase PRUNE1-like isoform X2 [Limulus polyphemus]|uniref:Exopolyphosphatase PRUNE1-like isoform X2 n=1 Tax=Limulus polyphemus TaxID=6850 RepID=A0ABM1TDE0_LIMPO|nr:exopolyphosphatase PRUNE1-like isoform X2 [Limulus polyphemus]